jgi:hypothetical protein
MYGHVGAAHLRQCQRDGSGPLHVHLIGGPVLEHTVLQGSAEGEGKRPRAAAQGRRLQPQRKFEWR